MRPSWMLALALALAGGAKAEEPPRLASEKDKVSYAIGANIARGLTRDKVDADAELVVRGLRDGLSGQPLLLPEQEIGRILAAFQARIKQEREETRRASAESNLREGEAFLAEHRTRDGVVTLPSGLQYRVLKAGAGRAPSDSDTVLVEYRGRLVDGTEFDSSYQTGQPATFKVNGVIAGWNEALKLMSVGARLELVVPPRLAYGGRGVGRGRRIGPYATLVFELELVAIL